MPVKVKVVGAGRQISKSNCYVSAKIINVSISILLTMLDFIRFDVLQSSA